MWLAEKHFEVIFFSLSSVYFLTATNNAEHTVVSSIDMTLLNFTFFIYSFTEYANNAEYTIHADRKDKKIHKKQ